MSDTAQLLRTTIRAILAEGSVPGSPTVNVRPIKGTYVPIGFSKQAIGTALALPYLQKAYNFLTCEDPKFPGQNIRIFHEKNKPDPENPDQKTPNPKDLESAGRSDISELVKFYEKAVSCRDAWKSSYINANAFGNGKEKDIIEPTKELIEYRCSIAATVNLSGKFDVGGDLFKKSDYMKFLNAFVDAAHKDFQSEMSTQRSDFILNEAISALYDMLIDAEKEKYTKFKGNTL